MTTDIYKNAIAKYLTKLTCMLFQRASLKMINLVRRMSSTGDDDIGINSSSTSIVHDDEKQ